MSMYQGHRGMGGVPPANGSAGRLNELLEQIRREFDSNAQQTEGYELQSKPFTRAPLRSCFRHRRDPRLGLGLGVAWPV
jgi:hypothetical protein